MSMLAPERAEPDERLISGSVPVGPGPRRPRRPLWHSVVLAAIATLLGAVTLVSLGEDDGGPVSLRAENGASTTAGADTGAPSTVHLEADGDLVALRATTPPAVENDPIEGAPEEAPPAADPTTTQPPTTQPPTTPPPTTQSPTTQPPTTPPPTTQPPTTQPPTTPPPTTQPPTTQSPTTAPVAQATTPATTTGSPTTADPSSSAAAPPTLSATAGATAPSASPPSGAGPGRTTTSNGAPGSTPAATTITPTGSSTPAATAAGPTSTAPTTAPPTTESTVPAPASGELVFEESFSTLDTSRWAPEHSTYGDGNNELQCYRPENVSVSAGVLRLQAVTETYTCPNGSTRSVTSGMVRSRGVTFEPGQALEFRVRLTPADPDDQGGLWPAVWSSGWAGGGWPRGGELDYLEVMTARNPNRSVYSIHYAEPDGGHGVTNKEVFGAEPFSAAWHIVRFEYGRNGRLVWYLDGVQVHAVNAADTIQGYPAPFDQAVNEIKINLALGGRPGPLSPGAVGGSGAVFEVDYLRIYRL